MKKIHRLRKTLTRGMIKKEQYNLIITEKQRRFARWVNKRSVFKSCTYQEYKE